MESQPLSKFHWINKYSLNESGNRILATDSRYSLTTKQEHLALSVNCFEWVYVHRWPCSSSAHLMSCPRRFGTWGRKSELYIVVKDHWVTTHSATQNESACLMFQMLLDCTAPASGVPDYSNWWKLQSNNNWGNQKLSDQIHGRLPYNLVTYLVWYHHKICFHFSHVRICIQYLLHVH